MTLDLTNLPSPTAPEGLIVLVAGEPGSGKTTFGSTFPAPVIMPLEEGVRTIAGREDVRVLPTPQSQNDVREQLTALMRDEHGFKTLVIDSVTALMDMIADEIVQADKTATSLATAMGGWNKGFWAAAHRLRKLIETCINIRDRRAMNIVWIAHSGIENKKMPDEDSYNRYGIRGDDRSTDLLIQYADVIGLCRQEYIIDTIEKENRRMIKGTGSREFVCHAMPAAVTKNRMGIDAPIPFGQTGENPLVHWCAT